MARPLVADRARPRPVGTQLHRPHAPQPPPPVVRLLLQHPPREPPALPLRVVGVLHPQLAERRLTPLAVGPVERPQLAREDRHRPPVADDVVHRQEEQVLAFAQPQKLQAHQRRAPQVEGARRLLLGHPPPLTLALAPRQRAEVDDRQRHLAPRLDALHGPAPAQVKAGAQRLVPAHYLLKAAPQRTLVEAAPQTDDAGDVVGRVVRRQLLDEPQPLLRKRRGQLLSAVAPGGGAREQRGDAQAAPFHRQALDAARQFGQGGRLEDGAQRQLDAEELAQAREQLRGEEGMAPQLEEVVRGRDARLSEQV